MFRSLVQKRLRKQPQKQELEKVETNKREIRIAVLCAESLWEMEKAGRRNMKKENAETRRKLKDITSVRDFDELIERTMLSEEEREIVRLRYKEGKPLSYIADIMGLSESSIKKKHSKILRKIGKMF